MTWQEVYERLRPIAEHRQIEVAAYVYKSRWKALAEAIVHELAHALLIWGKVDSSNAIGEWIRYRLDDLEADQNEASVLAVEALLFKRLGFSASRTGIAHYAFMKSNLRTEPSWPAWLAMVRAAEADPKVIGVVRRLERFLLTPEVANDRLEP